MSNDDLILHADLEERITRFGETNPIDYKICINRFDPTLALSSFSDFIQTQEILLCACNKQCNCKKECICDDDNTATLKLTHSDILSNCRYIFEFSVDRIISHNKKKQYLKGFHLDEKNQEEKTLFELHNDVLILYTSNEKLHFELDETYMYRHGNLIITFDYMRYSSSN